MHLRRTRAERLAPLHHTNSPYNLPEIGQKLADKANRAGVAEGFPALAVQQSLEVDLALIDTDDHLLTNLELSLVQTAKAPEAQTLSRLRSSPGVGTILALVRLDEIHELHRCPRVQEFVSYGRLVKCAKESAGKRDGTSGKKMGNASLKWAFAEAAVLFLRHNPVGQKDLARLTKNTWPGESLDGAGP